MLSPAVVVGLNSAGHDAVHVRQSGLHAAKDEVIFDHAADEERVLISADTDFGRILALRNSRKPSVILLRLPLVRLPVDQVKIILNNLPNIVDELEQGCIVVIEPSRVRVRKLPISGSDD